MIRDYVLKHVLSTNLDSGSSPQKASKPADQPPQQGSGRYIGAIDQGTTSSRFIIFDAEGNPVASHQVELSRICQHSGWHEQDPGEIVSSVEKCIDQATRAFTSLGFSVRDLQTIGLASQRETTIVWDWETGKPLHNAIAWPDTRTTSLVRELKSKEGADKLQEICGLPLSTYSSATKLVWLLRNIPDVKKAYDDGRLAFGTVDTWLVYNLNGGNKSNVFVTDVTNASRTMFINLHSLKYDETLLNFFEIDQSKIKLPKIVASAHESAFGSMANGPLSGIKITSCLGDQSAALIGHCAFSPGQAKNTYGTGCFLLYNVGKSPANRLYMLWKEALLLLEVGDARKINDEAATVPDSGGCVFVTAFSGLLAPYWIDDAKGTIFGLSQHTQRGHIARATLEAVCFQTKAILDAMGKDSGEKLKELAVDGGLSASDICMQSQSDIIQLPISRPEMHEITALGAAIAAGYAIGIFKDLEALRGTNKSRRSTIFKPEIAESESARMYKQWSKAVEMSRGWLDNAV
ncbi:hypothetical protein HCAG_01549 [Histoplasma mississippiense (nom. inval.)]|uniref:hypothetical protein n=1 Tax=Ajellomyces capsulatus (strain NAm1 / WU24) TaxID=2059318 RepID=UPI000157B7A2|nr:hypothetical protein HCAG_01549 [Histoplasma mississippiense (nom. inval.)]EDN03684.1 hypothetical protein HCAG_01549 [Histoplasma mississippiense (nom. inval.)]